LQIKSREEIVKQLHQAIKDRNKEPSKRTDGYIDALEWVLGY